MSKQVQVKRMAEAYGVKQTGQWRTMTFLKDAHLCCVSAPAASHILRKKGNTHIGILHSTTIQSQLSSWHLHLSRPNPCPFLLPKRSEDTIFLLIPFSCILLLYLSSLTLKRGDRQTLYTDSMGCQWQQKRRVYGIRPAISFDVNFIVNNYERTRETEPLGQHLQPVNPLMGLIESHSKCNTSAKVTWSPFWLGGGSAAHRKSVHWMDFNAMAPSNCPLHHVIISRVFTLKRIIYLIFKGLFGSL